MLIPRAACIALLAPLATAQLTLEYTGTLALPTSARDQSGQTFTVSGLSAITWLGGDDYLAVMDNSNRVIRLTARIDADGRLLSASFPSSITLSQTHDFEGLAFTADGELYLAEEDTPALHQFDLSGAHLRTITPPVVFSSRRPNFGFESLAAGDNTLWTANEEALTVDGPLSTQSAGTLVRLLCFEGSSQGWIPRVQYAYRCQPLHGAAISGARSGLSDLVALPGGTLLALERSFALSASGFFENRIYEVSLDHATDVSALPSLAGQTFVPASKHALWTGHLSQNLEGLTAGPILSPGRRALIGIVDDGDPISTNTLVSFVLSFPPCIADYNADGGIDGADVDAFFTAWESGSADVNSDGGVDGADVAFFFDQWESGSCP